MGCDWGYPFRPPGAVVYGLHTCSEVPWNAYRFEIQRKSRYRAIWVPACVLSVPGIAIDGHSLLLFGCQSICPGGRMDCFWDHIELLVGLSYSLDRTVADRDQGATSHKEWFQVWLIEAFNSLC